MLLGTFATFATFATPLLQIFQSFPVIKPIFFLLVDKMFCPRPFLVFRQLWTNEKAKSTEKYRRYWIERIEEILTSKSERHKSHFFTLVALIEEILT